jgi:hypothetical protein
MRRDTKTSGWAAMCALSLAALVGLACDRPVSPEANRPPAELDGPVFWEGCPAGQKFTGGGRIDPAVGKTTFGFNVHANDDCQPIKGQLQVVHHPTQSKYHSTEIREFESYASPEGGECGHWNGTVRAKHGNGDWHPHDFEVEACDNGEPGRGRDTFWFSVAGHGSTGRTVLTGGNIQAH